MSIGFQVQASEFPAKVAPSQSTLRVQMKLKRLTDASWTRAEQGQEPCSSNLLPLPSHGRFSWATFAINDLRPVEGALAEEKMGASLSIGKPQTRGRVGREEWGIGNWIFLVSKN